MSAAPREVTLRLDAYGKSAQHLVSQAQALADTRGSAEVEPLHLLYRLLDGEPQVDAAVRAAGVDPDDVLVEAEAQLRKLPARTGAGHAFLSSRMLELLGRAEGEAARVGSRVELEHLLLAVAQESEGPVREALATCGLSAPVVRTALGLLREQGAPSGATDGGLTARPALGAAGAALERFARDVTQLAAQGRYDPVVGRDAELRRMLQVLVRSSTSHPLLVGEHGVGRRSLVHALAQRIAAGDVPPMLRDKRVLELDLASLSAGARLRGELEERAAALLAALRDAGGEAILYVSDLGLLLSDRLEPVESLIAAALGRGELRLIAVADPATKTRVQGSALLRHLVPIEVEAPSVELAVTMLRAAATRLERAHQLAITDPALVAAAQLAKRYLPSAQLPKSALDVLDEAAARRRVELASAPAELDRLSRRALDLRVELAALADDHDPDSSATRARLDAELAALEPRLHELREHWDRQRNEPSAEPARIGEPEVAEAVAAATGIPVARMLEGEAEKLLRMEARLSARVIGQERAVHALARAVRRGRVGLRDAKRPIGSFLFLGTSGVGKTELAKALAEFLFDDESALTRLDMSEFMEKHSVSRLLGAPPGYVDSEEGGYLTEAVRRRPYSVLLFDEVEKAHPDVFNILLQVLDDGRLTDSRGRVAHFADTVIIMTSNLGSRHLLEHAGAPDSREEAQAAVLAELRATLRPELLNRIDEIVVFETLDEPQLAAILELMLRNVARLLAPRKLQLQVTDAAKSRLVDLGYDPAFGARPLRRVVQRELQDPLAEELLRGGYEEGDTVEVDVAAEGQLTLTRLPHA